jgi:hypothetical protein
LFLGSIAAPCGVFTNIALAARFQLPPTLVASAPLRLLGLSQPACRLGARCVAATWIRA